MLQSILKDSLSPFSWELLDRTSFLSSRPTHPLLIRFLRRCLQCNPKSGLILWTPPLPNSLLLTVAHATPSSEKPPAPGLVLSFTWFLKRGSHMQPSHSAHCPAVAGAPVSTWTTAVISGLSSTISPGSPHFRLCTTWAPEESAPCLRLPPLRLRCTLPRAMRSFPARLLSALIASLHTPLLCLLLLPQSPEQPPVEPQGAA